MDIHAPWVYVGGYRKLETDVAAIQVKYLYAATLDFGGQVGIILSVA